MESNGHSDMDSGRNHPRLTPKQQASIAKFLASDRGHGKPRKVRCKPCGGLDCIDCHVAVTTALNRARGIR